MIGGLYILSQYTVMMVTTVIRYQSYDRVVWGVISQDQNINCYTYTLHQVSQYWANKKLITYQLKLLSFEVDTAPDLSPYLSQSNNNMCLV